MLDSSFPSELIAFGKAIPKNDKKQWLEGQEEVLMDKNRG